MTRSNLIADRYALGDRLGHGGMSTVHEAFDGRLERQVAVKLLAEHLAQDAQFVTRFRREALAAARLVHPNVVQVFDFGLDERSGRHYIVMERIDGWSAAELLRDSGRLPVAETLALLGDACRGLEYAHRHGVIHRDVKPGNLLRTRDGMTKLADFGIAKALSDESSITQIGSVLGTAAYLAPEQATGSPIGPAADVYAVGVVAYQLLSGRLPYEAKSLTELALMQQNESPPLLHDIDRAIPASLALAVDRALELDPRDRWPSAEAMGAAFDAGARGEPPATAATRITTARTAVMKPPAGGPARARTPRTPRAAHAPDPATAAAGPAPARERRGVGRRSLRTLGILMLIAGAGAGAVLATSPSQDAVNLRRVVYDDADRIIVELRELVRSNAR